MNLPDVYELYDRDERFKTYVEKYRIKHGTTVDVALKHSVVNETAEYYRKNKEVK